MSGYRLLKHRTYDTAAEHLPLSIQRKAVWSQVLLGTRGRTPNVKTTTGYNARWRRTPVQGYHYYLWWIPLSESGLAERATNGDKGHTILVHSIRHHDETDDPIVLNSLDEFDEILLADLDPRYDEQRSVGEQFTQRRISLATVKGLPGSGKTVSLFYLVKDLAGHADIKNILYVTYTSRLKRAAREFLGAQNPEMEQRVRIRTFNEMVSDITGVTIAHADPFADLRDFTRFLDLQNPASLGLWKKYPQTLYTELRAYLYGRTFPDNYPLPAHRSDVTLFGSAGINPQLYAAGRELDLPLADLACRLADRLRDDRYFLDQKAASRGLAALTGGKAPAWLRDVDALIVDEVQDLTLLQIALLSELARVRTRQRPAAPLVVAIAGDESQIVQPSGFDWGVTKDVLRDLLGINPVEFEFRHQRRSPRNLARLIDNAWSFYGYLPKTLRPSANRQTFIDDAGVELAKASATSAEEENGRILICALPDEVKIPGAKGIKRWQELVTELANLPGRALIDLTESLQAVVAAAPLEAVPVTEGSGQDGTRDDVRRAQGPTDEVVFLPREIKGLERNTVLIHGLNNAYEQAVRLAETGGDNLPHFEARRLFDEMRVALSRSTDKLVLLETPGAPVLSELNIANLEGCYGVGWDALLESLKTEEMSEIEVVEGYLDEADDLLGRGRWEQARRRNRRAYDLAVQIDDRALLIDAQEQYIQSFVQEATDLLARDHLQPAHLLNRQAYDLAEALGDPLVLDEVDEQFRQIRVAVEERADAVVAQAAAAAAVQDYATAYTIAHTTTDLLEVMHDPALQARLDEAAVAYGWQWGIQLRKAGPEAGERLAELFTQLGDTMQRQADKVGARAAYVSAERYRTIPHRAPLSPDQVSQLLRTIDHYLETVAPLSLETGAFIFVESWLEEAFASLGDHVQLYYDWAIMAQTYAVQDEYPALDEHLWDLENQVELRFGSGWKSSTQDEHLLKFAAFSAAYNGDAAQASVAWEKLGQIELAAHQAREAGDLERAYNLLRRSNTVIPEELSIAVKLLRLVEQLRTKHSRLRPAERRLLAEHLDGLSSVLAATPALPDDELFAE